MGLKKFFTGLLFMMAALPVCSQNYQKGTYGYLYCHMSDRGEWTAYAISRDGENWQDLLGGDSIYSAWEKAKIEGGVRDAYICRTHDGKGYLMCTTDMCVKRSHKWNNYGMNLMKSKDLIHWESVTIDFRNGPAVFSDPDSPDVYKNYEDICRVWAPQIIWNPEHIWPDGKKGGYMIYYSLLNDKEDKYDRIFYSYANDDFTTITKPKLLIDWGYATIDTDINFVKADGMFHLMIKKEGGKRGIFTSLSKNLEGPWPEPDESDYVDFEGNKNCEGPSAFQLIGDDTWRVAYIEYSSSPKHYRICKADKYLRNFSDPQDIRGVASPQHGSFMTLTKKEYKRLAKWGLMK